MLLPSRSRAGRAAISEACKLAGTAKAEDGRAAAICCASPSLAVSNTALVISSTNNGMPSVRSTMSCLTLAGSSLLPMTRLIRASISGSPSRFSETVVT